LAILEGNGKAELGGFGPFDHGLEDSFVALPAVDALQSGGLILAGYQPGDGWKINPTGFSDVDVVLNGHGFKVWLAYHPILGWYGAHST
jgi:hypothetical protein